MNPNSPTPKWKLALIPILLLVLVAAIWNTFSQNNEEDLPELLTPASLKKTSLVMNWKLGRRNAAVAYNPFKDVAPVNPESLTQNSTPTLIPNTTGSPGSNDGTPTTAPQNSLESLTSQPVTLLIRKGKKEIAVIGDQVIHSGQRLDSGYQVESIDLKRILLSNPDGQITLPMGEPTPQR